MLRVVGQTVVSRLTAEPCKLSLVNGTAFLWPNTDISAYLGTEGSNTPYKVHVWDAAGKVAIGYLGAVGGGETPGADVLSGWDFTSGWTARPNIIIDNSTTFHITDSYGIGWVKASPAPLTIGALYKQNLASNLSGGATSLRVTPGSQTIIFASAPAVNKYFTSAIDIGYNLLGLGPNGATFEVVSQSCEPITDPPATALHIVSAKNGSVHNWAHIDAGFNYNAASYNVQIMRAR